MAQHQVCSPRLSTCCASRCTQKASEHACSTCRSGGATSQKACAAGWRGHPDPRLDELITELEGYLPPFEPGPDHLGFAVPLRLNTGDGELRLITTITSFATAVDVTVAELFLEAFLPADEPTADILRRTAE